MNEIILFGGISLMLKRMKVILACTVAFDNAVPTFLPLETCIIITLKAKRELPKASQ